MLKNIWIIVVVFVFVTLCNVTNATAGWFDNALENAKERVGTRAVDETADGAYDAAKDAAFNKNKGGNQETTKSKVGSSIREPERHQPAAGLSGDEIDDNHFIQKDDYFVSSTPLGKNSFIYVTLCKMVTEPSTRSKGEAEFFKVIDGSNFWSKYYYQSRIALDGDIHLGTLVIVMEGRQEEGVSLGPETKEEARGGTWYLAKITDLSDLYRGHVTVSGNYKISLNNLRVLLPNSKQPAH